MARRVTRGKRLPLPLPETDESESNDSNREESKSVSSGGSEPEDIAVVQGQVESEQAEAAEEDDDDDDDEEEEVANADDDMDDDDGIADDEEDFRPPPTPRVRLDRRKDAERERTPLDIRNPQDYGRNFSELIDTCNSLDALEDEGKVDKNFQEVMSKNITTGRKLFESLMKGSTDPNDEFDAYGARKRGGGPGDMYLAFLHTKITTSVVKKRAERIGTGPTLFTMNEFLANLKQEYVDQDGDYSASHAVANIAVHASYGSKSLLPLVAVVGTFDRDAVVIPKEKKPRARRVNQDEPEEGSATLDEPTDSLAVQNKSPAAMMANGIRKILKVHHRQSMEPVNLFEFVLDKTSFPKTIENIFNFSFLVKDGHASVSREDGGKFKDLSFNIKPEKSPNQKKKSPEQDTTRNQVNRHNYILSFSPRTWKNLCAMSQGENTIEFYQHMIERQAFPDID